MATRGAGAGGGGSGRAGARVGAGGGGATSGAGAVACGAGASSVRGTARIGGCGDAGTGGATGGVCGLGGAGCACGLGGAGGASGFGCAGCSGFAVGGGGCTGTGCGAAIGGNAGRGGGAGGGVGIAGAVRGWGAGEFGLFCACGPLLGTDGGSFEPPWKITSTGIGGTGSTSLRAWFAARMNSSSNATCRRMEAEAAHPVRVRVLGPRKRESGEAASAGVSSRGIGLANHAAKLCRRDTTRTVGSMHEREPFTSLHDGQEEERLLNLPV